MQRLLANLRTDEVDVRVDPARGEDPPFAGDRLGAGADHDVHTRLDVRVAGLADADDPPVLDPDIGLHHTPMVEDHGVGDDRVDGTFAPPALALPHAVADHLAAAELDLLARDRVVALDLDPELGVGQADLVAHGRAEHRGVSVAADPVGHGFTPPAGRGDP